MTVCITGDVHHMSLGTRDQEYLDGRTEVDCALEYASIAAEYDVPVTLFITGKAAVEESEKVRWLGQMDNVEIGGHNYYAFSTAIHMAWRGLDRLTGGRIGSWNGPRAFQSWEIRRTIRVFRELDIEITSWRDHAYRHDENTAKLLAKQGLTHFTDVVEPDGSVRQEEGLTVVPINTPPDHEHIYHAYRTPEYVETEFSFEGPFGTRSYEIEEWRERLQRIIKVHQTGSQVSTILAHPACMALTDDFSTLSTFFDWLSEFNTAKLSQIDKC